MDDEEEITEKKEIVTTKIKSFRMEDSIITMKTRTIEQMGSNDFENHLDEKPNATNLHPDELDLLIAYRVMNELGKSALFKVAQDFAMTKTMRNKCVRGIKSS